MKDTAEINESPEKQITKTPEKKIDTFDDLKASDNSGRIGTFDDIRNQGSDGSIKTFDDLKANKESGDKTNSPDSMGKSVRNLSESTEHNKIDQADEIIKKEDMGTHNKDSCKDAFEKEHFYTRSSLTDQTNINNGRHRVYAAMKEAYSDVPVRMNDVYKYTDGRQLVKDKGITHVSFDYDILKSRDMQDMMKEHDFQKWEQGLVEHKGFTYNDHVKEFERLHECQEAIKNGHSPDQIESLLGKEHADTYKRFYETNPIKIDRVIEMDKS